MVDDLQGFADLADHIVGQGWERFDADDLDAEVLRGASRQLIVGVVSAIDRIDTTVLDEIPEIPWGDIRATRNYIAHACDQVDHVVVWEALDGEIRRIGRALARHHHE